MKRILIPVLLSIFFAIGTMSFLAYEEDISIMVFHSYDTQIPSYIMICFLVIMVMFIIFFSMGGVFKFLKGNKERKRLLVQGRDAQAKVISLDEASDGTITTINEQPLVTIELEIQDRDRPSYQVKLETVIARLDIPKLQPGNIIKVKIDPKDPNNVVLA